jgi:hypothetical protein
MDDSLYLPYSINTSPGAAKFEWDMLFGIPFIADWRKIGDYATSN